MMVISIVFGALGPFIKGLVQRLEDFEIRGRVETMHCGSRLEY